VENTSTQNSPQARLVERPLDFVIPFLNNPASIGRKNFDLDDVEKSEAMP